jgi:hypothetical protein
VHAFAVPLFGLEGSLDGVPPAGVQKPPRTAVVYKTEGPSIVIAPVSLFRRPQCLAIPTGLCYTPAPEAAGVVARVVTQYELHQTFCLILHQTFA